MDLNSMLQREDFFSIFFATIERYYKEVYGADVKVSIADGLSNTNLVIYPRLSAAVTRGVSRKARGFFYSEWNVRGSRLRNWIVKLYVVLMTHSHGLLAQHKLSISPEVTNRDIVIAPNNRSIRFFDYANDIVGCMVKQGFTGKYFDNQLQFRIKHSYSFVLPPLRWGADWFIEPILHGHPLARVTDQRLYQEGVSKAVSCLGTLAKDTRRYLPCRDYVESLKVAILSGLALAMSRKKAWMTDRLEHTVKMLSAPFEENSSLLVPLVTSHGDLQDGNIWVEDGGKVWVYDWETVGERSVWYDACTLLLCTRRAGGIEKLWNKHRSEDIRSAILVNDDREYYSSEQFELIIRLLLLEDIQFHLEDLLELPENWGSEIFNRYINRLISLNI